VTIGTLELGDHNPWLALNERFFGCRAGDNVYTISRGKQKIMLLGTSLALRKHEDFWASGEARSREVPRWLESAPRLGFEGPMVLRSNGRGFDGLTGQEMGEVTIPHPKLTWRSYPRELEACWHCGMLQMLMGSALGTGVCKHGCNLKWFQVRMQVYMYVYRKGAVCGPLRMLSASTLSFVPKARDGHRSGKQNTCNLRSEADR
jgi:hypothetical protein